MKTALLTGTTGFLGSALAAQLLARGVPVLSLSRNDPDGSRTRAAVERAARGFGFAVTPDQLGQLQVLETEFKDLGAEIPARALAAVTEVWHCAAHMSYSLKRVEEALHQNLVMTASLYQLVAARSPLCERFHHVSTAYTAGIDGGVVREELHPRPKLVNAYQLSKWCAEQSLASLSRESPLPVTIFRPTIVTGHSRTGWSSGNSFGYFMVVNALRLARIHGARTVRIDLNPASLPNLIPVDEVVEAMVGLSMRRPGARTRPLEIFNCAHVHRLTVREHTEIIGEGLGIDATCGPARTVIDEKINQGVSWNREFASTTWDFSSSALSAALAREGVEYCRAPVDREMMLRMVRAFAAEAAEREKASRRDRLAGSLVRGLTRRLQAPLLQAMARRKR